MTELAILFSTYLFESTLRFKDWATLRKVQIKYFELDLQVVMYFLDYENKTIQVPSAYSLQGDPNDNYI